MTFILFLILSIPGQSQPAVHREEMSSLEECLEAANLILHKAVEKQHLLQAGCIVVPPKTEGT